MTAYQYKPQLIYNIDPAPEYPDEPMLTGSQQIDRKKFIASLERFRDNTFSKRR
jgi:hypothetical protein